MGCKQCCEHKSMRKIAFDYVKCEDCGQDFYVLEVNDDHDGVPDEFFDKLENIGGLYSVLMGVWKNGENHEQTDTEQKYEHIEFTKKQILQLLKDEWKSYAGSANEN